MESSGWLIIWIVITLNRYSGRHLFDNYKWLILLTVITLNSFFLTHQNFCSDVSVAGGASIDDTLCPISQFQNDSIKKARSFDKKSVYL